MTQAQRAQRRAAGAASWKARIDRDGEPVAQAHFWLHVGSKTRGRPTREQASEKAWAEIEERRARRGRAGYSTRKEHARSGLARPGALDREA